MGILTKDIAGSRTEARLGRLVDGMELWGPDLRLFPSLEEQIARLDEALSDPARYAAAWVNVQAELADPRGIYGAGLRWNPDDPDDADPELFCGAISCDDQEPERFRRSKATREHRPDKDEYHRAIVAELMLRKHYHDDRRAPRQRIFQAIRALLEHRGSVMVSPRGSLEISGGWPGNRDDDRSEASLEAAEIAVKEMAQLMRRRRAQPIIRRVIRMLGTETNGWIVLEASNG